MTHPFERLSTVPFIRFFCLALAATIVLAVVLGAIGAPLGMVKTLKGGSCDIVSFEFAGTVEHAYAIVDAWNAYGLLNRARWNTWLDYLFLLSYPNLVALAIIGLMGSPLKDGWQMVGRLLAWAQWLVLASDAIENVALLRTLYGSVTTPWPQTAYVCAAIKFGFLFEGLLFVVVVFSWRLFRLLRDKFDAMEHDAKHREKRRKEH